MLIPVDMWDICGIYPGEFHTYIILYMGSIRILITITSSGSSPVHFKHPHPNGPKYVVFYTLLNHGFWVVDIWGKKASFDMTS